MQVPKITVRNMDLATLLTQMQQGNLQIPRFQREFVWPTTKTRSLLDSMFKEFPIGTFFFWHAPNMYHRLYRNLAELNIPEPQPGFPVSFILDGQQRLTSLYVTINGLNGYDRICIDLARAAEFESEKPESYDQDIFVTRTPNNRRYVAVNDLLGINYHETYKDIPEEWQPVFSNVRNRFITYPFSVVWVQDQPLSEVVEIFQRINQGGKRLNRYDLVCANVWTPEFDFRRQVATFNERLKEQGFGKIDETIITQSFALILRDKCTTATELDLSTEEIQKAWIPVITAIKQAIDFAQNNLGVARADFLPYRGILTVLTYYFYFLPTSTMSAVHRDILWQWFWRVALSERYGSTSPSRMAEDAAKLRSLIKGKEVEFNYPSLVDPEAVARVRMTSTTSALRNAILCMLALRGPRNFKDNSPVNLRQPFFSTFTQAERHHIFPVAYLRESSFWRSVHLAANFCFIPAALNKEISDKAPSDYLTAYHDENPEFASAINSHLIPIESSSPVWADNYDAFIEARSTLISETLNGFLETGPSVTKEEIYKYTGREAEVVQFVELSLRDLIDDRLTAVSGENYWKQCVPSDVKDNTKERIKSHLAKHPYDSWADFPPGRRRLDLCDVADYEKIVLVNWGTFAEVFGNKQNFQQHMNAFREYRNAVAHNRTPSNVQKKLAEAAIIWLEQIISRYGDDTLINDEESEDE